MTISSIVHKDGYLEITDSDGNFWRVEVKWEDTVVSAIESSGMYKVVNMHYQISDGHLIVVYTDGTTQTELDIDPSGGGVSAHGDLTGVTTSQHHVKYTSAEAVTAAKTVKLDDLTAPDDTTDLDAAAAKHGLMPKVDKSKLDGIAASAIANVVEDTTPQLGGALDVNEKFIGDGDADTGFDFEQAADEDIIRGKTAGTECFHLSAIGELTLAKQSRCRVYRDTDQWAVHNGATKIGLTGENYDEQNEFNITAKTGTADATGANKLHDADGGFAASDVGAMIWNTTDNTYTTVSGFVDSGELDLTDDIMVDTEGYELFHARFTAKEAGYYLVSAVSFINPTVADKYYSQRVYKNGANAGATSLQSSYAFYLGAVLAGTQYLAASDYLELWFYQNSGDVAKIDSDGTQVNIWMDIQRLS